MQGLQHGVAFSAAGVEEVDHLVQSRVDAVVHVGSCTGDFPERGCPESLPVFLILGDEVSSGILGQGPILLEMIDLGDEPAGCCNPRVFQVFGILPDMEDVEPVVSQIDAVMAFGTLPFAGEYFIPFQRLRRKSIRVPAQKSIKWSIAGNKGPSRRRRSPWRYVPGSRHRRRRPS